MSLPNISYMSMADTGANGDKNPVIVTKDFANNPCTLKRLKYEYSQIVQNHDLLPSNVSLSWKQWDNTSAITKMPMEWTFVVKGELKEFELVVHFPCNYPFEKPYYYVKTNSGTRELTQYLIHVTMKNEKSLDPNLKSEYDYVRTAEMTAWLAQSKFRFRTTVADYISPLLQDEIMFKLLQMAPDTNMA